MVRMLAHTLFSVTAIGVACALPRDDGKPACLMRDCAAGVMAFGRFRLTVPERRNSKEKDEPCLQSP